MPVDPGHPSDADERASALIRDALHARRDHLSGSAQLPAEDRQLSERILGEARRRSAEITAAGPGPGPSSSRRSSATERVPWWLWLGWIAAIAAVALAFRYLA